MADRDSSARLKSIAVFENLPSGGARRALYEFLSRLNVRYEIDLFTFTTSEQQFCNLNSLVNARKIYPFQPARLFRSPFGRLNQARRIRDLIRLNHLGSQVANHIDSKGYDVVFAHHCRWTQAPLLLRHLETPSVYFCQEIPRPLYERPYRDENREIGFRQFLDKIDPLRSSFRKLARWYDADSVRSSTKVLVNSNFSKEIIEQTYRISPEICYLGVDIKRFCPKGLIREDYLLSVGAIHPRKGFDFLIRSLGYLPEKKRFPLVLVGDSELPGEKKYLSHLARECGVELKVEIGISNKKLVEHYNRARLMLYSPHREPFGLAPIEAMACGLAVLAVDEGGVKETVVNGMTGRTVRRDAEEFALCLGALLETPELTKKWGMEGRSQVVQSWNWNHATERLEHHLKMA